MHLLFFHKKENPEAPTWFFVNNTNSNSAFESSQKCQTPWAMHYPGETTVSQKRLQQLQEGQTPVGKHNALAALSKRYADTTFFKKILLSRC